MLECSNSTSNTSNTVDGSAILSDASESARVSA